MKEETNNLLEKKQTTAYDVELKKLEILEKKEEEVKQWKKDNKYKIIGLFLAFLTIASLFDFGFLKTLGIWFIMLIGYGLGAWFDRDRKFIIFIRNLIRKLR